MKKKAMMLAVLSKMKRIKSQTAIDGIAVVMISTMKCVSSSNQDARLM